MAGKTKEKAKETNWELIEVEFRTGERSTREIASRHRISEGAIRARAKKQGWTQSAAETKRRIVADRMAGGSQGIAHCVKERIEEAAEEDTQDMNIALRGARAALQRAVVGLETEEASAKDTKTWSETIKLNVDTIRRIRGLDQQVGDRSLEELLEDANQKRSA